MSRSFEFCPWAPQPLMEIHQHSACQTPQFVALIISVGVLLWSSWHNGLARWSSLGLVLCSKSWRPLGRGAEEGRGGIPPHLCSLGCDQVPLALRLSFNCPSAKESCKRRPAASHPGSKGFIHCPMTRTLTPDPACPHAHTLQAHSQEGDSRRIHRVARSAVSK